MTSHATLGNDLDDSNCVQLFLVDWPGSRPQEARQLMSVFSSDEVVPGISPTAPVGLAI